MAIDASIPLGVRPFQLESPVNQLAKVLQMQSAQQDQQLGRMKMDEYQRGIDQDNALSRLYQSALKPDGSIDRNALFSGAAQQGLGAKIPGLQKTFAEQDQATLTADKQKFELAKQRHDYFKTTIGTLAQEPGLTKDMVVQAGQALVDQGILPAAMYQQSLASMPDDPHQLRARLTQGLKSQMTPEQIFTVFAPKATQIDNGQQIGFRDTNPNSPTFGQQVGGPAVQKVMTPGETAADARARAQLGETRRHNQEMEGFRGQEVAGDRSSGAPVLGAPIPQVLPWANQSNPKDANKVKASEMSRGAKEIEKDSDLARKEADTARAAARFIELNKKISTGGLVDRMGVTRWAQGMGDDYAEMESITAKLVPASREPGSGASSDLDVKMFERGTLGVDKPRKTNENIAKAHIARAQQAQDYADFRQTYLEQNGTLQGSERHWKEYVNANPIFDASKPEAFELNSKRKAWREHFKGGNKPAAPASGGGDLSPAEKAELEALRRQLKR